MNLNLMAFGPRRTLLPSLGSLLEAIYYRGQGPGHCLAQRLCLEVLITTWQHRKADTQVRSNLLACQSNRKREPHRVSSKFIRAFRSHSQSPLPQLMLSKERYRTATRRQARQQKPDASIEQ